MILVLNARVRPWKHTAETTQGAMEAQGAEAEIMQPNPTQTKDAEIPTSACVKGRDNGQKQKEALHAKWLV